MNEAMIKEAYPDIRRFAYSFKFAKDEAEELVQDVAEKLLKISVPASLRKRKNWLRKVVKYQSISNYRKIERERRYIAEKVELSHVGCTDLSDGNWVMDPAYRQEDYDDETELFAAVQRLEYELTSEQWLALNLVAEGATYDEVASRTGVSVGTVRSRLHYARQKAKDFLKPYLLR